MKPHWWSTYGAAVLAAVTGGGYLVGMASVAAFADTLGVSVRDLGIGTRDYLALAAVYGLAMAGFVALSIGSVLVVFGVAWPAVDKMIREGEDGVNAPDTRDGGEHASRPGKQRLWVARLLGVVVVVLSMVVLVAPIVTLGLIQQMLDFSTDGLVMVLLFVLLAAQLVLATSVVGAISVDGKAKSGSWWLVGRIRVVPPSPWARTSAIVVLLTMPIATIEMATQSSQIWANQLLDDSAGSQPAIPANQPWALHLVIQPALGEVEGVCTSRIAPTVFLTDGFATVRKVDTFSSNKCHD